MKIDKLFALTLLSSALAMATADAAPNIRSGIGDAGSNMRTIREQVGDKLRQQRIQEIQKDREADKKSRQGIDPRVEQTEKKQVHINKVIFTDSKVLNQQQLEGYQAQVVGKIMTIAEIKQWLAGINQYYTDHGYSVSQAIAAVDGETLKVQLLEPTVDKVTVTGNNTTKEHVIKDKVGIKEGDLVNLDEFRKNLQWFNVAHDVNVRVNFEPGTRYATTHVEEVVSEPNQFSASFWVDNYGQDNTGETRAGAVGVARSVFGYRDNVTLGTVHSEGTKAYFMTYELPVPGTQYLRMGIGGDYSETEIKNGSLSSLDLDGLFHDVYAYVKSPIYVSDNLISNATFQVAKKRSNSYISGWKMSQSDTSTASLTGDLLWLFDGGYLYNQIGLTKGLTAMGGDNSFTYFSYDGELNNTWSNGLFDRIKVSAGFSNQDSDIPSYEGFQIGGVNSVRGYDSSFLSGAKGFSVQIEGGYDISHWLNIPYTKSSRLFAFFDYGKVKDDSAIDKGNVEEAIYSTGIGLRVIGSRYWSADLTFAHRLADHPYEDDQLGKGKNEFMFMVKGGF